MPTNHTSNKTIIGSLIIAAFIGGVIGSLVSSQLVRAGVGDILKGTFFKNPIFAAKNLGVAANGSSTMTEHERTVVSAVDSASPAVVSIIISKDVPVIEQCAAQNPFANLPPEFQQFFDFGGSQQYTQPCQKGTKRQEVGGGSGFIISEDGYVLTNKHVVSDKDASYTVLTNDGKKYDAKVLAQDPVFDLAIVKFEGNGFPTIPLGDSDGVKLGQTAIAIGNALGEFRNTVSVGVISGLSRTITASGSNLGDERIEGVFQIDAAINPGNSGGPLLDSRGRVIGINVATVSGAQNIGFSIPINQAKRAIASVRKTGTISAPYIGVRYLTITPELADTEKLPVSGGALLRGTTDGPAVEKNSPADTAGLKAEDIITKVNDQPVDQSNSFSLLLQKYNVGDIVTLTVMRGKLQFPALVRLGARP